MLSVGVHEGESEISIPKAFGIHVAYPKVVGVGRKSITLHLACCANGDASFLYEDCQKGFVISVKHKTSDVNVFRNSCVKTVQTPLLRMSAPTTMFF